MDAVHIHRKGVVMKEVIGAAVQIRESLKDVSEQVAPFFILDINRPDALLRGMRGIDGKSLATLVKKVLRDVVQDRAFAEQLRQDVALWAQLEDVSASHEGATALHTVRSPKSTNTVETRFAVYADIRNGQFVVKEHINDNAREVGSDSTIGQEKVFANAVELIDARLLHQESNLR